jgi:hypothetical protein
VAKLLVRHPLPRWRSPHAPPDRITRLLQKPRTWQSWPGPVERIGCLTSIASLCLAYVWQRSIDAPVGHLAMATIRATTAAMERGSASEGRRYERVDRQILSTAAERDELASQIKAVLEGVAFEGRSFDKDLAERLIAESNALLKRADSLESD